MAAGLLIMPQRMPARDRNGRTCIGYVRVYQNKTVDEVSVYSDASLTVALSQPITSDASGVFPLIWYDGALGAVTMAYEGADGQTQSLDDVTASTAAAAAMVNAYAGAVSFGFSTTIADADPGAGKVRYNNATVASVDYLYVDNTALGGTSVTGWLDSFDDANTTTNRGTIALRSITDLTVFTLFTVTGVVVDGTGYRKIPVAYLSGSLPADGAQLVMGFAAAGPASAATLTIGTATALATTASPTATNSGTTSAAVLDLGIPRGAPGGVLYVFSTTTTDSDPGAGKLRLNNATPSSATAVFINNADGNGNTVTGWLDTFDDSTNPVKGTLSLRQLSNGLVMTFNVTDSVVDGTGYRKLTVAHTAGTVLFDNDAELSVTFERAGNLGSAVGGDVNGPASATANAVTLYDGTTGKLLKDSTVLIGTSANNLVQLDGSGKLPAVSGENLTGLPQPGWNLVTTVTASASTYVEFDGVFTSTYDEYVIIGSGVTDSATGGIGIRTKQGGSYNTSGYNCRNAAYRYSISPSYQDEDTYIKASNNLGVGGVARIEVTISKPTNSAQKGISVDTNQGSGVATTPERFGSIGQTPSTDPLLALRFQSIGGGTISGDFRLYALKK